MSKLLKSGKKKNPLTTPENIYTKPIYISSTTEVRRVSSKNGGYLDHKTTRRARNARVN